LKLGDEVRSYGSYDELLRDDDIDVIYIGLQNQGHCEWVCKAAEHHKHILCEKPMAVTAAEVQCMMQKASESGVFLMEACWSRFFPAWRALRKAIESKEFGEVRAINANFGVKHLAENRFRPDIGASPLNDIGIYTIMFAMFCCNDQSPTSINVVGSVDEKTGCDKSANITLEFNGGAQKAYLVYTSEASTPNSAYVSFENGIYEFPEWFFCPSRVVKIIGEPRAGKAQAEVLHFPFGDKPGDFEFSNASGFRYEMDHVYECLKLGRQESPIMPLQTSLKLQEIMHELRRQLGVVYAQDMRDWTITPCA